jgi:hypothetical protein
MTGSLRVVYHDDVISLHVPFHIVRRRGRREMQLPQGALEPHRTDGALGKALARAFRWKRMLESGDFASAGDLAAREGISPSYVMRLLKLTLFAPYIVEATLDGMWGADMTLPRLLEIVSEFWSEHQHDPL